MTRMFAVLGGMLGCLTCLPTVQADDDAVRKTLSDYVDVFNQGAHQKIGEFWTENGTHVDRATGERTEGRDAIQAEMQAVLTDRNDMKLSVQIHRVRFITPEVAGVEGETTLVLGDEEPGVSAFAAIVVRQGDRWLLESIEEMELPQPETSADALSGLEWLVGDWVDEGGDVKVATTFRWTASQAFLLRSFTVESADDVTLTGTQVIGWDPRGQQIRGWSFNSDGSFGESTWSQEGTTWLVKSAQTLAGGDLASGTYVIERMGDDSFSVQVVGKEVEGELQPAGEAVKVVRVTEEVAPENAEPAPESVSAN